MTKKLQEKNFEELYAIMNDVEEEIQHRLKSKPLTMKELEFLSESNYIITTNTSNYQHKINKKQKKSKKFKPKQGPLVFQKLDNLLKSVKPLRYFVPNEKKEIQLNKIYL